MAKKTPFQRWIKAQVDAGKTFSAIAKQLDSEKGEKDDPVNRQSVHQWLSGPTKPQAKFFRRIAKATGLGLLELAE